MKEGAINECKESPTMFIIGTYFGGSSVLLFHGEECFGFLECVFF